MTRPYIRKVPLKLVDVPCTRCGSIEQREKKAKIKPAVCFNCRTITRRATARLAKK